MHPLIFSIFIMQDRSVLISELKREIEEIMPYCYLSSKETRVIIRQLGFDSKDLVSIKNLSYFSKEDQDPSHQALTYYYNLKWQLESLRKIKDFRDQLKKLSIKKNKIVSSKTLLSLPITSKSQIKLQPVVQHDNHHFITSTPQITLPKTKPIPIKSTKQEDCNGSSFKESAIHYRYKAQKWKEQEDKRQSMRVMNYYEKIKKEETDRITKIQSQKKLPGKRQESLGYKAILKSESDVETSLKIIEDKIKNGQTRHQNNIEKKRVIRTSRRLDEAKLKKELREKKEQQNLQTSLCRKMEMIQNKRQKMLAERVKLMAQKMEKTKKSTITLREAIHVQNAEKMKKNYQEKTKKMEMQLGQRKDKIQEQLKLKSYENHLRMHLAKQLKQIEEKRNFILTDQHFNLLFKRQERSQTKRKTHIELN